MAAVAGLRGTGNWGNDERPQNFREMILWMRPDGSAPLFALTSKMGKRMVNDPNFHWWYEPQNIVRIQLDTAVAKAWTETNEQKLLIDSTDPSSSSPGVPYGLGRHLVIGDLLMVDSDTANYDPQIVVVSKVTSDEELEAKWVSGPKTATADNSTLTKIGNMFAEGTRAPTAASRNPIQQSNQTQIFKTTYNVTGTAKETYARTGDLIKNERKRKMFDHANSIEFAMLFGKTLTETDGGAIASSTEQRPARAMDGLRAFIGGTVYSSATKATYSRLIDTVSPLFDWDSPAGDSRIAFCGNGALNGLNKMLLSTDGRGSTDLQFGGKEEQYGVKFRELIFPQGRLMLKTHPLMSRHPTFTNSMFVIDASCLRYVHLKGRDTWFKDNVQHNDEDSVRGLWTTECSIQVDMGGITMRYIGGLNNV